MHIPQRGHRLFLAGVIGLLILGAAHSLAVFKALFIEPNTPEEIAVKQTLINFRQSLGPFEPNGWGIIQILNISYSALVFFAAALNLVCWKPVARDGGLKRLAHTNAAFCGVLALVPWLLQFPPPAVLCTILTIVFWAAAIRIESHAPLENA